MAVEAVAEVVAEAVSNHQVAEEDLAVVVVAEVAAVTVVEVAAAVVVEPEVE